MGVGKPGRRDSKRLSKGVRLVGESVGRGGYIFRNINEELEP